MDALASLYCARWCIATNLGHLKTTMGLDVRTCQTVNGVRKELIVFALIYNLVRLVMWEAAKRQRVDGERISFIDAARWLAAARPRRESPPSLSIRTACTQTAPQAICTDDKATTGTAYVIGQ